jgi:hypothetical protein
MYFAVIRQNITNFFLSLSIEKYTFQNFTNLAYYTRINTNGLVSAGGGNWEFQVYWNNRSNSYTRQGHK